MYILILNGEVALLLKIFQQLDLEIIDLNLQLQAEGSREIPKFYVKIVGQSALLEANTGLVLNATMDIDAYANFVWVAREMFCNILNQNHLVYDDLSNEIWMPEETKYVHLYNGYVVDSYYAEPEYVLLSKIVKAPQKNKNLIVQYLAKGPSKLFLLLCKKYNVDLKGVLND